MSNGGQDTAPSTLTVTDEARGAALILHVSGEIDIATAGTLEEAARAHGGPVVLDLAEVRFVDSTGVRALIDVLAEGGPAAMYRPSPAVRRMLALTRLDDRFTEVPGLEPEDLAPLG